jgi:uncharacterized protein YjdB
MNVRLTLVLTTLAVCSACNCGNPVPNPDGGAPTLLSITVSPSVTTVQVGAKVQLSAAGHFSDGSTSDLTGTLTWTSGDLHLAQLVAGTPGEVLGVAAGDVTLTAANADGVMGTSHVTVVARPTVLMAIDITPSAPSLAKGTTLQLTATGTYSDATKKDLTSMATWSSSSAAVSISTPGLVRGDSAGTSMVKATVDGVFGSTQVTVTAAALVSLQITPTNPMLAKGTTRQLTATGVFSDGSSQNLTAQVTWSSSAPAVTVSSAGLATAAAIGTSTVSAKQGAITGTTLITVSAATLTSLAVTPVNPTIAKGTTQQLVATGTYSDATTQDLSAQVTWTVEVPSVATVSSTGLAMGTSMGSTHITAAMGSVSGSTILSVTNAALVGIAVTPPMPSIAKGTHQPFAATGTYSDGTTQDVTTQVVWSAMPTTVATISNAPGSEGQATGAGVGTAVITASLGAFTSNAMLSVTAATLVSLQVGPSGLSIAKGTQTQLTATGLFTDGSSQDVTALATWTSSDMTIATVSSASGSQGQVSGVAPGPVTITAIIGTVSGQVSLSVTAAVLTSLQVEPPSTTLAKGTRQQLTATGIYSDGSSQDLTTQVTWGSMDPTIAAVSNAAGSAGLATAVGTGTTKLSAALGLITGSASITVTAATLTAIQVTAVQTSFAKGTVLQLTATGVFSDASTQDLTAAVTWSAPPSGAVSVSNAAGSEGLATALNTGSAIVTATLGTTSGTLLLNVTAATLVSIQITGPAASFAKGTSLQLTATGTYSDSSTQDLTTQVSWASMTPAIVAVSSASGSEGLAFGAGVGSTSVSATLGGVSGTMSLSVSAATLVSIQVTPPGASIAKGTQLQLAATGLFTDGSSQDLTTAVTWSSSDATQADVSNATGTEGLATGTGVGQVTVTATLGSVSGSTRLTITSAVLRSIEVAPSTSSIAKGTTVQLAATGIYSDASRQDLTAQVSWSSSVSAVATVSNAAGTEGLATGAGVGMATITAAMGTISGAATLNVTSAVLVSLQVAPTAPSIAKGTTQQFSATGVYSDGSVQTLTTQVTWSSSPAAVATISNASGSEGLATGAGVGTSTITATLGPISGNTTLGVSSAVLVTLQAGPANASIAKGTTQQLSATGVYSDGSNQDLTAQVTWSSSDPSVAVSNASGTEGLATGASVGSSTVTATLGAISGSTTLSVTSAVLVTLQLSPTGPSIAKGTTVQLSATGVYSDGSNQDLTAQVTWASSDGTIATVSNAAGSAGVASGVRVGGVTVTASMGTIQGSTGLSVTAAVLTALQVSPGGPSIAKGTTVQLSATGIYSDGTNQDLTAQVTWSASPAGFVTVSNAAGTQGLVTGVAVGGATVTAALGTISQSTPVTVTSAVLTALQISPTTPSIAKGTSVQLSTTGLYSDGSNQDLTTQVTWGSSDKTVATVSNTSGSEGLAMGAGVGGATITATLGTISRSTSITVTSAVLTALQLTPGAPSIAKGTTQQFTATGVYSDSSTQDLTTQVTWGSSDNTIATVSNAASSQGFAQSVDAGTTTISAALGTVSGSTLLTVTAATLVSIQVTPGTASIAKGTTRQFNATGTYTDGSTQDLTTQVTWTSSDMNSATISNASGTEGLAFGVAVGGATLTATLGTISGTAMLNITSAGLVSIGVTPANPSIAKGTTQQFLATGLYTDGSTQNLTTQVTWNADMTTATISNAAGTQGLATGAMQGSTTVSATLGAISGSTTLSVTAAVLVSIQVTPASSSVAKGTTLQFTATGLYSDGSSQTLTTQVSWITGSAAVATISNTPGSQGLATGTGTGPTTVTASLGGVSGSTGLTVTAATLTQIQLNPDNASIAKGTTQQFTAIGVYSDSSTQDLTTQVSWSSVNTAAATISNAPGTQGLASAVAAGGTTITATLGGLSASTALTVTAAVLSTLDVSPVDPTAPKGTTVQFQAIGTFSDGTTQDLTTQVTWTTSDGTVMSVSNASPTQGLANALAVGTATITATLGGISDFSNVTVTNATLQSIAVTPTTATIAKGTTQQFIATGTYSDGSTLDITAQVTWTSGSAAVASISNAAGTNGRATGVAPGTTSITATTGGLSAMASLTVTNATLVSIALTPASPRLAVGFWVAMTATGTFSDGSTQNLTTQVTWLSSVTTVAAVSNALGTQGRATALAAGTSTISASFAGITGTTVLTATTATLVSIVVTPGTATLAVRQTQQMTATGTFSDGSTLDLSRQVNWKSAPKRTVSINQAGLAMAKRKGMATITASKTGIMGSATITVP